MKTQAKNQMPPHGNTKYPWELWENGELHTVKQHLYFPGLSAANFRRMVIDRARRSGKTATTRVKGNTVTFQFSEKSK